MRQDVGGQLFDDGIGWPLLETQIQGNVMNAHLSERLEHVDEGITAGTIAQVDGRRRGPRIGGKIKAHRLAEAAELAGYALFDGGPPHAITIALLRLLAVIGHPADRVTGNPVDALPSRTDCQQRHGLRR